MSSSARSRTTSDILVGIGLVLGGAAMAAYSATATRVSVVILAWALIGLGVAIGVLAYLKRAESNWWLRLGGGVLLVVLGVLSLTNPATTRFTLSVV
nr:hypothetical protein [Actinomycetales bacterium]